MKSDAGKTDSIWTDTADVPFGTGLSEDDHANVCIIGAGIAGMSTAYMLARQGKSVIVVDDGEIAGGETGRTTAHLSNALDDRYMELERLHGERGARLAAESHTQAIDAIERIITEENIDCDFSRLSGYLFLPPGGELDELHLEFEAARRAGLRGVRLLDRAPLPDFDTGACIEFPNQGQLHAIRYMRGLADAVERRGGRIFTRTHVTDIRKGDHPVVLTENGRSIRANFVVVATNSPINTQVRIHTKQEPYRTYVIGALIPK